MKTNNNTKILKRLGLQIRNLRQCKSISQEELASIAGVHRTYIGMVERGEKNVTILTLTRMSQSLGVSLVDIIKDIENEQ